MSQLSNPRYPAILQEAAEFRSEDVLRSLRDIRDAVGTHPPFKIVAAGAKGSASVPQFLSGAGGAAIEVSLQVTNAKLRPCLGDFLVEVWIATTEAGAPGGTQTVGAPSVGSVRRTESANQAYVMRTGMDGRVVFEVTAATGTRWLLASIAGVVFPVKLIWS